MIRRILLPLFASLFIVTASAFGAELTLARDFVTPKSVSVERGKSPGMPRRVAFDKSRFPNARRVVKDSVSFPNLGEEFEVVDPMQGKQYNCIAHSFGVHSYWVNPKTGPSDHPLRYMDNMYREKGYTRVSGLDFRLVAGMRKVALYTKVSNGRVTEVTHAALQERDGSWSSKLGQLPLIRHANPQAVSGPSYGRPIAVYVKYR